MQGVSLLKPTLLQMCFQMLADNMANVPPVSYLYHRTGRFLAAV